LSIRYILVAAAASAVTLAATVSGGVLASTGSSKTHYLYAHIGDTITIPAVDLYCTVNATDLEHHDPGPLVYCDRNSAISQRSSSRGVGISRYHYYVSTESESYIQARFPRSP
jgi:hypothetical protein